MALSNAALQKLISCTFCSCRAPDAPDDMSLGTWFRNLGIEACLGPRDSCEVVMFLFTDFALEFQEV